MFEFTVSAERANLHYIDFLHTKLQKAIFAADAVIALSEADDRIFFSIGCEESASADIESLLFDGIADVFALGFKNDYLKRNLAVCGEGLLGRTVLNTMTVLDSDAEKSLVRRALKGESKVALEGFFEFRLQELKERWSEVVQLANGNSLMFYDESAVCDFLSFLIDSIPQNADYIKVIKHGERGELLDGSGKQIAVTEILDKSYLSDEERLLFNVICLSPKRVTVENKKMFSDEFNGLISELF